MSLQVVLGKLMVTCRKGKADPKPCTKIRSKWTEALNIRCKSINYTKENVVEYFLTVKQKASLTSQSWWSNKNKQIGLPKTKKLLYSKTEPKRQWEWVLAQHSPED